MKKIVSFTGYVFLCVLCFLSFAVAVSAASGTWGENITWTYDETTRTLRVSGEGEIDDDIYDSANDKNVYPSWHEYRDEIENVVINEGITAIGESAFRNHNSLTNVKFPESLLKIGFGAFYGCGFDSIQIPRNVNEISYCAFGDCRNLSKISVDPENEYLADKSGVLFDKDITKLICYPMGRTAEAYTVPNSVTHIVNQAFSENTYLKNISLPDSLEYIGFNAMGGMYSLHKITIPATTQYVDSWAFRDCLSLTKIDVDSDNETYVSRDGVLFNKDMTELIAFPCGKKASEYVVPETITLIAEGAFFDTSLSSIQLPETLLFIDMNAFSGAENLKTVCIPASVEMLGFGAFFACASLESIYFQGDLPYDYYPNYYLDYYSDDYEPDDIPLLCLEERWFPTYENDTVDVYYQIGKKGWDTLDADELAEYGIRLLTFTDESDDAAPLWSAKVTFNNTSETEAKSVTLPDGGAVVFEAVAALPEYMGIRTPEQLDAVRYDLSGKYILLQDIDLSKWDDWNPIGSFDAPFTGVFDGNGYDVSSLRINFVEEYQSEADSIYAGLFGVIKSAEIRNLTLTDGEYCITSNRMNVGGIAGCVDDASLLTNCSFNGVIK